MSTYNGWTNYETWNLALWLGNDECSDSYWRETAAEALERTDDDDDIDDRKNEATHAVADMLKDQTEEQMPEVSGFYADVLGAAISSVNFYEIAGHWVDEAAENLETA